MEEVIFHRTSVMHWFSINILHINLRGGLKGAWMAGFGGRI
jgi:hypothetical protein